MAHLPACALLCLLGYNLYFYPATQIHYCGLYPVTPAQGLGEKSFSFYPFIFFMGPVQWGAVSKTFPWIPGFLLHGQQHLYYQ
jgi:hypothetical protein